MHCADVQGCGCGRSGHIAQRSKAERRELCHLLRAHKAELDLTRACPHCALLKQHSACQRGVSRQHASHWEPEVASPVRLGED